MENGWWPSGKRAVWARGIAVLLAGLCLAGWLYAQDPTGARWYPKCVFHSLTGWHCPGCGASRAAHALLHGDLAGAFSKNVLLVCGAPLAAAIWLWREFSLRNGPPTDRPLPSGWIWAMLVVIFAFTILRNIPAYPFTMLAPH